MSEVLFLGDETLHKPSEEQVLMMLYIKDKYNVSGRAYHELASLCKAMPCHYMLKRKISELNSQWELFPTPPGTCGVQLTKTGRQTEDLYQTNGE